MNVVLDVILCKVGWNKCRVLIGDSGSGVEWLTHWLDRNARLPVRSWGLPELLSNCAWAVWFFRSSMHSSIQSIMRVFIWSSVIHSVKNGLNLYRSERAILRQLLPASTSTIFTCCGWTVLSLFTKFGTMVEGHEQWSITKAHSHWSNGGAIALHWK